ncbi:MAG: permease [Myxococcota bacterium]|nr:permease [Myxococcota bacterium]
MGRRPGVIDGTLVLMLVVLAGLAGLAWWQGGAALVTEGFQGGSRLLLRYALVIAVSLLAAGFAEVLVPREWVRETLGEDSGLRGILIATGAGVVTPAGPFVSMPIAAVLLRSGAGLGPVVAFLTGWSLLALHRFVAWEVPILGWRFALLRWSLSLGLPVLAGLLARGLAR